MTRADIIQECIDHLRGQPGRNAVRALKRLQSAALIPPTAPHPEHEEILVKIWQLNGMGDPAGMAARCQGAMLCADSLGRREEGDDYALLYLVARRLAWEDSAAQLAPQPGQQKVAQ